MMTASAAAVDVEELDFYAADGVIVTATDATDLVDISACVVGDPVRIGRAAARNTEWDLSDGSTSIDWNLEAESTSYNSFNYKTNTQKITIHLKGDLGVSITVRLYDSSGSLVGSSTKTVGTIIGTDFTFSSLTAARTYYFSIENNSQKDVNLVGSVYQWAMKLTVLSDK